MWLFSRSTSSTTPSVPPLPPEKEEAEEGRQAVKPKGMISLPVPCLPLNWPHCLLLSQPCPSLRSSASGETEGEARRSSHLSSSELASLAPPPGAAAPAAEPTKVVLR